MILNGRTSKSNLFKWKKGTAKIPVEKIEVIENHGFKNDAHAGSWHRQVSLLSYETREEFKKMGYDKMVIGCLDKNPSNEFYKHMGGKYVKTHIFEKLNLDENLYLFDI